MWNVTQPYPALFPPGQHLCSENLEMLNREPPKFAPFQGVTKSSQAASAEHVSHLHPGVINSPPSPALSCHHLDTPTYATANI